VLCVKFFGLSEFCHDIGFLISGVAETVHGWSERTPAVKLLRW
jgi:hypothetical protein